MAMNGKIQKRLTILPGALVLAVFLGACNPPPDRYHIVQTRALTEEAQFDRDEALRLDAEIRSNNQLLRELSAKISKVSTTPTSSAGGVPNQKSKHTR